MLNNSRKEEICSHNVYIKGLCGNCGTRLDPPQSTSVSMIHSVPELKVSREYAKEIGKADQERLIQDRKLVLLVDLDQTVLHTTHEEVKNDPNVYSFTLWSGHPTYYTKLRPYLQEFLDSMSELYELHIFTFGCRKYAHKIASIIDPKQKYFGNRILSRDESVDQYSKKGNLNNLFPCGDAMVCIIDDRSDVWREAGNLIKIEPYSYFKTSISDGAEEEESLKRDVDKLEALLGLDDEDEEEDDDENKCEKVEKTKENEDPPPTRTKIEHPDDDEDDESTSDSCNHENKKTKTADSEIDDTSNCDGQKQATTSVSVPDVSSDKANDSMLEEQKERTPSPFESDEHLLLTAVKLEKIHEKWYLELDEQRRFLLDGEHYKLPDIKDIIKRYKF